MIWLVCLYSADLLAREIALKRHRNAVDDQWVFDDEGAGGSGRFSVSEQGKVSGVERVVIDEYELRVAAEARMFGLKLWLEFANLYAHRDQAFALAAIACKGGCAVVAGHGIADEFDIYTALPCRCESLQHFVWEGGGGCLQVDRGARVL